jgi:hypothetical protein
LNQEELEVFSNDKSLTKKKYKFNQKDIKVLQRNKNIEKKLKVFPHGKKWAWSVT